MLTDAWDQYLHSAPPSSAARARVLIVDDEPAICEIVDRMLRQGGYETEIAYNGAGALARVETGSFDLLLTDVKMPDVSGDALAAEVRRLDPDIKVLYFTGYSDQLFKDKGVLWEGEAFVDKPASGQGLLEAVALLLTGHVQA
jgi:CheY-like chemotaxis protein